uniref:Uncharacterized protein n=1 Tax=Anguilla anguilla TaxID=7936 RepID=A0A0E9TN05_ANGAN
MFEGNLFNISEIQRKYTHTFTFGILTEFNASYLANKTTDQVYNVSTDGFKVKHQKLH